MGETKVKSKPKDKTSLEQTSPDVTDQTPLVKPIEKRVILDEAFKLRMKGYTFREIAERQGVSYQAVQQRLEAFTSLVREPENITTYRENEAEILDGARLKLIRSLIDKADDPKASVNNLAYAFTQINQAGRLLKGESTANIHNLLTIVEQSNREQLGNKTISAHTTHTLDAKPLIIDDTNTV